MKGFTLVEILVIIGIFVVILITIVNGIVLANRIYWEGEKMTEIMQNGRVVLSSISREIRQSRKIVTSLPEDDYDPPSEIIFQDGHLARIIEKDVALGGSADKIILADPSSGERDFYKDAFIKILDGPEEITGEIRKIISYDGEIKEARLEFPFESSIEYFGSEYLIDTSYYYIRYHLDENGSVWREIFTYYFSGSPDTYVPFNADPPQGESLETENLESPQIIGEHFREVGFWGSKLISISLILEKDGREVNLLKKVFGRNL